MYAVTYTTESGDRGFMGVYLQKPTEQHLLAMVVQYMPDEVVNGKCYVYFDVLEIDEPSNLPEPYTKGDISFI
jgi:hypothetical protein